MKSLGAFQYKFPKSLHIFSVLQTVTMILSILLFVFLTQVSFVSTLSSVLQTPILAAQCSARCDDVVNSKDLSTCLAVCKLSLSSNSTDLCLVSRICKGSSSSMRNTRLVIAPNSTLCNLAWNLLPSAISPTLYVVAGKDEDDLWNLITPNPTSITHLSTRGFATFNTVRVFAVDKDGIVDQVSFYKWSNKCQENRPKTHVFFMFTGSKEDIFLIFCLVTACTIAYFYRKKKKNCIDSEIQPNLHSSSGQSVIITDKKYLAPSLLPTVTKDLLVTQKILLDNRLHLLAGDDFSEIESRH